MKRKIDYTMICTGKSALRWGKRLSEKDSEYGRECVMGIWLAVVNLAGGVKQGPLTGNWHGPIYNNAKK